MLAVKYLASGCVFFGWVINEQNGTFFYQIDDRLDLICRNGRAAITSSTELVHLEKIGADILASMHHDIPSAGTVVKAPLHAPNFQRQPVVAIIGSLGDIESKAALMRRGVVGERAGKFLTRVPAMRHIGVHQHFLLLQVEDIKSFVTGRLAKVADRQDIRLIQPVMIQQIIISFECVFECFFGETHFLQIELLVEGGCFCGESDGFCRALGFDRASGS